MKKIVKKISFILFIVSILFVSGTNIYALDTIRVSSLGDFDVVYSKYLQDFGLEKSKIIKANGEYVYCLENALGVPTVGSNLIKTTSIDLGLGYTYILENGYPNKSLSGLADAPSADYAITQLALYYYQQKRRTELGILGEEESTIGIYKDKLNGTNLNNIAHKLNEMLNSSDNTEKSFAIIVTNLVDAAIKYEADNKELSFIVDSDKFTLSADGKYYVSEEIMLAQNLSYSITTNVAGAIIKDRAGNVKSNFNSDDEFIVMIPVDKYVSSITIKATSQLNKYNVYYINDDNTGYQTQKIAFKDGTQTIQGSQTFTVEKSSTPTPEEPEEPTNPEEPESPEEPTTPEEPENPEEPTVPDSPKDEVEVPKTDANIPLYVWTIGIICIVAGAKLVYSRAK